MDACSPVDTLSFCRVGAGQQRGESANAFEELVHEWPGQVTRVGRVEGIHHGCGRCEFPLGDASALGDQGGIHSGVESVEVLTELLAGVAGLESRSA
jgi:hypothetical protein